MAKSKTAQATDRRPLTSALEVAQYLGVSRGQIYDLMNKGVLPYYRVGSLRRLRWEDVDRLLAQGAVAGAVGNQNPAA